MENDGGKAKKQGRGHPGRSEGAEDNEMDARLICKCPDQADQPYEDLAPSQAADIR